MLLERIDSDLILALKEGNEITKEVLRSVKSAAKYLKTDQGVEDITDDHIISIIQKEVKRHRESISTFTAAGRHELVEKERQELEVLMSYLPKQLGEQEIANYVERYLLEHPTTSQDLGRAMQEISRELKGKADLSLASKILRDQVG